MKKSKVAVVACPDYEPAHVKESLQKGLEAIGGLESLIGKEENILLKPNLVRSAKRERAVVTDPEVMDALITILQENGYENISCGDSCGLGTPEGIAKEAGRERGAGKTQRSAERFPYERARRNRRW